MTRCPFCGEPLEGLGTFCWHCERYTSEAEGTSPEKAEIPDARSEDERKRDAFEAVTALGWWVVDTEQGFRPFTCRHCGGAIAGGTRVVKGMPDWCVMGHGVVAWIEWKTPKNTQTPDQKRFADRCKAAGVPYRVCRTTEEAVAYLTETKARAA